MASFVTEVKHLEIQLEDIISATNNFDETKVIGSGGFGKVYAGELSHSQSEEKSLVAIKRLDRRYGQGDPEFYKEIRMLSCYRHENLISLLGFCCQGGEMILIYEYASRGSLDRYLSSSDLTWMQRLRICIDAAKGLSFLHDPNGTQQRVLHCDIKSANILLDKNMTAKVSDFELSKMGPANQQYSLLITSAVGTLGYCDPLYMQTYSLTKESDVYSFGVVLFEVMCGRLCAENSNGRLNVYVPFWRKCYEENKLNEIVMQDLIQQMDPSSLKTFSDIASQCLRNAREERPTMSVVVEKLQIALQMQVLPKEYKKIANAAVDPLLCRSLEEFKELLSKGVLLNGGKTWLSLNDKEEHHVMVSIEEYLSLDDPNRDYSDRYSSKEKSRFAVGCYKTCLMKFKLRVTAPLFLSPNVTYGLNLVLHASEMDEMKQHYVGVRYKIQGETKISILHIADKKEGKELVVDLEIFLEDCGLSGDFYIEGIEFRPLEKVERQVVIANQEIVWGVVPPLLYRFTEESKVLLSQGVLLNGGKTVLSIKEKGEYIERIYIQSCLNPDEICDTNRLKAPSDFNIVNSRFPGGLCYLYYRGGFKARVRGQYLTPQISYTLNLVIRYYNESDVNSYNYRLRYKLNGEAKVFIIYPSTHMREDGWFIAPLYHFTTQHTTADLQFQFEYRYDTLLIAGIEFQPSEEKVELQVFEEYQHIVEAASQSLFYTSLDELKHILSKGVLLNGYKTWFSLNKKGEHCHMISMEDCLIPNEDSTPEYESHYWSRFPLGLYQTNNKGFKTHVKTQFLSPSVTYTVNLVYYSSSGEQVYADLKYRLRGEATTSIVYLANKRQDDYLYMAELYQFTSDGSIVDLEIIFENSGTNIKGVEGIIFQPLQKVEDQLLEGDKVEHIETISDSETYWEQKIPNDYEEILKLSKVSLEWKTKKELYSILCKGFMLDNGHQWFSIDKNGKKCQMLCARATASVKDENNSNWESSNESRFGEVLVTTTANKFEIKTKVNSKVVSPETAYAAYLVFKLPQDQSTFEAPIRVEDEKVNYYTRHPWFIYLVSPPHTPVIGPKFDENSYNPLNRYKGTAIPQQRIDGWMEVKVWQFKTKTTTESVPMRLYFKHPDEKDLKGLIVQGIELRPI